MKKLLPALIIILTIFTACKNQATQEESSNGETDSITEMPATLLNGNGKAATIDNATSENGPVITTIQVVDEEGFNQKIFEIDNPKGIQYKGKLPALVDFYADWCAPCRALTPTLVELAEQYAGEIIIYKVNVEKCPNVSQALNIQSIPALLFLKPNTEPKMAIGSLPKEELQKMIEESLLSK